MKPKNIGMRLLKKGKTGLLHSIFSRLGIILLMLLLQIGFLLSAFEWFGNFLPHIFIFVIIFMIGMIFYLINCDMNPSAKITWLILIMTAPLLGVFLLWFTQADIGHRALKERLNFLVKDTKNLLPQNEDVFEQLKEIDDGTDALVNYVNRSGCFPIFPNTEVTFFPVGEDKFAAMLKELEKAKHYIFMEYFIVEEGNMWGQILEILAQKAAEGVEVRVMYDGMCEFSLLSHDYPKRLQKLGIQCKMFSPVTPFISTHYNYRDHRKILVIDGHTAFNGGVNLADEYINEVQRFGHWKDTAVMLKGEAVQSFTLMFLQMWNIDVKNCEYLKYIVPSANISRQTNGFVMPYGDCPLDNEKVGKMVYMDILNRARDYVHIITPYLILDGEMETALKFAAQRGVEVALILPGIPDKKTAFALAKTHYVSLLEAGVHIYEYSPGFVHAKVFVSDNKKAVIGTINLDYRSLYHHFECATYLYQTDCIYDIEADYQKTLSQCRTVTIDTVKCEKWTYKAAGALLKIVAPLM